MEWKAAPLFLLQLLHYIYSNVAFNLYTEDPIVKEGLRDSYFGFSVAQHIRTTEGPSGSLQEDHLILVGAPKDNVTDFAAPPEIRNLVRPGAVYHCPISSSTNDCQQVKLMQSALMRDSNGDLKEGRDDQWLGVSVASQGTPDGMALACAHRYRIQDLSSNYIRGPGICLSMSNLLDEEEYLDPCSSRAKNSRTGHGDYAFCAAGTSCDLSEGGQVLLGTPGVYNWHGEVVKNIIALTLQEGQQWYESAHKDEEGSEPPPLTTYYSYLGMAVAITRLDAGALTYVAGAPRSKDVGEVFLLHQQDIDYYEGSKLLESRPERILTGEQFGSGFGYSMVAADFNGDGLQDLVVGAPFQHGNGIGGVIYVYNNSPEGITKSTVPLKIVSRKMSVKECVRLDCQNARFGFSLGAIGDVDRDGYQDLAVGAPFEGSGVLYIFRGSERGLVAEHSQRIAAEDMAGVQPLKSFGYSLAGGHDVDDNTYPDLVVGAYESAKLVVFRARPVVNVFTQAAFVPKQLNSSKERCDGDGRNNNCFKLLLCFTFTAKPKEKFTETLSLKYRLVAETFTGRIRSRVFFRGHPDPNNAHVMTRTIRLNEQTDPRCKEEELLVYIIKGNMDFLNPINFQLTYELDQSPPAITQVGDSLPNLNTYPVLNDKASVSNFSVEFHKNCGIDKTCDSELRLEANFELQMDTDGVPILKEGQDVEPKLHIRVNNVGEDAHEATLYVTLPEELSFTGVTEEGKKYSCLPKDSVVSCSLGNPLMRSQGVRFAIRLNPAKLRPSTREVHVEVKVNTTSKEITESDNLVKLQLRVVVETDLLVRGRSKPELQYYGGKIVGESAIRYEDEIGSQIVHSYEVKNEGKGKVGNATVMIWWPYEVENHHPQGKHLLYLMEAPMIKYEDGEMERCNLDPKLINPLGIKTRPANQQRPNNATETKEERSTRVKRENVVAYQTRRDPQTGKNVKVVQLDCDKGTAKCFKFSCVVGKLEPRSSVIISMRSRLWNSTFLDDYTDVDEVRILSKAQVEIDPRLNVKQTDTDNDVAYAETRAIPDILIKQQEGIPLWVIIVAVCAGILLLILIIVLLWKCGFFKRKTAEDMRKHKANLEKQKHTKKTGKNKNKDFYN